MKAHDEIQIRNSERITWTTCPQKWWWAYVDRLRAPGQTPALRFGSLVHSALEEFYRPGIKRGPKPAETYERLFDEGEATYYKMGIRDEYGDWHEMKEFGIVLLEAYYNEYGKDERWYVVATEMPFRVRTVDRETGLKFTFVGVVDGLWGDRYSAKRNRKWGKLYVADHKTTRDDPTKKHEALILDEQSGSYWSYGVDYIVENGILPPGQALSGMLFNFLRKGKPDPRPTNALGQHLNKDGTVSKVQPAPLFHRAMVLRDLAEGASVRARTEAQAAAMHYMRTGKLRLWKTPGTLFNPHCNYCEFKAMCELHESGADWEELRDLTFGKWDPYEQHEVMAGERI